MNNIDRYKILIRYAKDNGFIGSQKDLAYKLGYKDEVSFSQIINGKTKEPKDFIQRINKIIPFNPDWLLTGNGEMLLNTSPVQTVTGDGNHDNNMINSCSTAAIEKLIVEMSEQRKTYAAIIDKLIDKLQK